MRFKKRPMLKSDNSKSFYEITVDLVRSIIWPFFIGVILFIYSEPITETINQIPNMVATSSELSIAGVKVQIDREIRAKTSADVLRVMSQLSPDGIERLMDMSKGTPVFSKKELPHYQAEWKELLKLKLVEIVPWDDKFDYGLRVSILGRDAQQFVFVMISHITGKLNLKKD